MFWWVGFRKRPRYSTRSFPIHDAPHRNPMECIRMPETYLSDVKLSVRYGVHRSTPWRWVNSDPTFPKPVKLSPQCSRWKLSEIEAWESNCVSTT